MSKTEKLKKLASSTLLIALGLNIGIGYYNIKASNTLQSQGKLVYTNPETGQQEVVIDTNDIQVLQELIEANTTKIETNTSKNNSQDSSIANLEYKTLLSERSYSGVYDFNTITDTGFYVIGNLNQASNGPAGVEGSGFMTVYNMKVGQSTNYIMQTLQMTSGKLAYRITTNTGVGWSSWFIK